MRDLFSFSLNCDVLSMNSWNFFLKKKEKKKHPRIFLIIYDHFFLEGVSFPLVGRVAWCISESVQSFFFNAFVLSVVRL